MRKKLALFILFIFYAIFLSVPAMAASAKFVRGYRDGNFDMYINRANIV